MKMRTTALAMLAATGCVADPAQTATNDEPEQARAPAATPRTFTPLVNQPPVAVTVPILLRDGTVIAQEVSTSNWYKLTADANGSYLNGTWAQIASMPSTYGPLYYGSAVLPDGRVIVQGGEYNFGQAVWTNLGAIYDPLANMWTNVPPPSFMANIGDAQSIVLADGRFMIANALTSDAAFLDPVTLTYTQAPMTGKLDGNDEEGWTLLWNGKVLTVDCNVMNKGAELYTPSLGSWVKTSTTQVQLADIDAGGGGSHEMGPLIERPDGTVFAAGAIGHNSVYDQNLHHWTAAPDFPKDASGAQLDIADGPGVLLPNGNVLLATSPGVFQPGLHFFEWDGASYTEVGTNYANLAADTSFQVNFLILPTGEILTTDQSGHVELYTGAAGDTTAWQPVVTAGPSVPATTSIKDLDGFDDPILPPTTHQLSRGTTYSIKALRLNGVSQGTGYGDDGQNSTNYPIIRITNRTTGHVSFARTHGSNNQTIKPTAKVATLFDIPTGADTGISDLEIIANGVASAKIGVRIN
jgi:hypothetical protein